MSFYKWELVLYLLSGVAFVDKLLTKIDAEKFGRKRIAVKEYEGWLIVNENNTIETKDGLNYKIQNYTNLH